MAHILPPDAQTWLESTKMSVGTQLDANLEAAISAQVIAQVSVSYDTSGWVDNSTTPVLVKQVIGMMYASWVYQRAYSEDVGTSNEYALFLQMQAQTLLMGIIDGSIELVDDDQQGPDPLGHGKPGFYPNDAAATVTDDGTSVDPSDPSGWMYTDGPKFRMGRLF